MFLHHPSAVVADELDACAVGGLLTEAIGAVRCPLAASIPAGLARTTDPEGHACTAATGAMCEIETPTSSVPDNLSHRQPRGIHAGRQQ